MNNKSMKKLSNIVKMVQFEILKFEYENSLKKKPKFVLKEFRLNIRKFRGIFPENLQFHPLS